MDEHVKAAEPLTGAADGGSGLVGERQVGRLANRDRGRELGHRRVVAVDRRHLGPLGEQAADHGRAERSAATGDERAATGQAQPVRHEGARRDG